MGRKLRAEAVSRPVAIRLSPQELRRACEAARVNRQQVSQFIREAILCATEDCLEASACPTDEHQPRCLP